MPASGASNSSIATELKSSAGAIEAAIRNIYTKLSIPDTPQYNRRVLAILRFLAG